ncbi:hypothetical protein RRG08_032481 [Elysia crispata]|uniref:Uncharacterized protein n=1 Tax=Elysia crispata TaxID=231223 RepID=A0AAE1BC23_9GAST|nr:hypothetical protein RRG08_032481 [Elysia crispata]
MRHYEELCTNRVFGAIATVCYTISGSLSVNVELCISSLTEKPEKSPSISSIGSKTLLITGSDTEGSKTSDKGRDGRESATHSPRGSSISSVGSKTLLITGSDMDLTAGSKVSRGQKRPRKRMEEIDDSDVSDTISGSQAGVDTKAKREKKEKISDKKKKSTRYSRSSSSTSSVGTLMITGSDVEFEAGSKVLVGRKHPRKREEESISKKQKSKKTKTRDKTGRSVGYSDSSSSISSVGSKTLLITGSDTDFKAGSKYLVGRRRRRGSVETTDGIEGSDTSTLFITGSEVGEEARGQKAKKAKAKKEKTSDRSKKSARTLSSSSSSSTIGSETLLIAGSEGSKILVGRKRRREESVDDSDDDVSTLLITGGDSKAKKEFSGDLSPEEAAIRAEEKKRKRKRKKEKEKRKYEEGEETSDRKRKKGEKSSRSTSGKEESRSSRRKKRKVSDSTRSTGTLSSSSSSSTIGSETLLIAGSEGSKILVGRKRRREESVDDSDDDVSTLLITGGDSKAKKAKSKKSKKAAAKRKLKKKKEKRKYKEGEETSDKKRRRSEKKKRASRRKKRRSDPDLLSDEEEHASLREELRRAMENIERELAAFREELSPEELERRKYFVLRQIDLARNYFGWAWKNTLEGIIKPVRETVVSALKDKLPVGTLVAADDLSENSDPETLLITSQEMKDALSEKSQDYQTVFGLEIDEEEYQTFKAELKRIVRDAEKDSGSLNEPKLMNFMAKHGYWAMTSTEKRARSIRKRLLSALHDKPSSSEELTPEELERLQRQRQFLLKLVDFLKKHGKEAEKRPAGGVTVLEPSVPESEELEIEASQDMRGADQRSVDRYARYRSCLTFETGPRPPCKRPLCERLSRERSHDPCSKTKKSRCKTDHPNIPIYLCNSDVSLMPRVRRNTSRSCQCQRPPCVNPCCVA